MIAWASSAGSPTVCTSHYSIQSVVMYTLVDSSISLGSLVSELLHHSDFDLRNHVLRMGSSLVFMLFYKAVFNFECLIN